jgi:hypothetical protein
VVVDVVVVEEVVVVILVNVTSPSIPQHSFVVGVSAKY